LKERFERKRRVTLSRFAKRLYRDTAGGPEHAVLIAGVARSGTTWLAEVLAAQLHARLLFEPFNPLQVEGFRPFEYLQYKRPDEDDPALERFVTDVLSGRLRDPGWIDRMVSVLDPEARVVKAVRACLMLRWIHDRFPRTPTILIVRHPCAVAASFAKLGWSARQDLESILRQRALLDDQLEDVEEFLRSDLSPHEEVAAVWCVNHRVALRQCTGSTVVHVYYEDLVARPERELPRIFEAMGRAFHDSALGRLGRPSRTTKSEPPRPDRDRGEPAWREALIRSQEADIEGIVRDFGLDHLYDGQGRPTGRLRDG
jgi:hypothetical protein